MVSNGMIRSTVSWPWSEATISSTSSPPVVSLTASAMRLALASARAMTLKCSGEPNGTA